LRTPNFSATPIKGVLLSINFSDTLYM
jgi:hypothetical protein